MTLNVLYRISDGGNSKVKPEKVYNKKTMFRHFIDTFQHHQIYVFADNVCDDTYNYIISYFPYPERVFRINLGNSFSFLHTAYFAIQHFEAEDTVYFAEDDYIYTPNAPTILEEGLAIAPYVTGYDHPDKYVNRNEGGPNPYIERGGEATRVLLSPHSHWKWTNSTCMTFGTKVKYIVEDMEFYIRNCQGGNPNDFELFCQLYKYNNRFLISPLPAVCTHGETQWLAPLVDWNAILDALTSA